jgi:ATP-dependent Lon protease
VRGIPLAFMAPVEEASRLNLVVLPLRNQVIFPFLRGSFEVPRRLYDEAQALIDQGVAAGLGAIALRSGRDPVERELYEVGTHCRVVSVDGTQDDGNQEEPDDEADGTRARITVEGLSRFKVLQTKKLGALLVAEVELLPEDSAEEDVTVRALVLSVQEKMTDLVTKTSEDNKIFRSRRQWRWPPSAAMLTSVVGATLAQLTNEERQKILETVSLRERLELVLDLLQRESQAMKMSSEISEGIQKSREQELRQMVLQRQAQEIQRELQRLRQKAAREGDREDGQGEGAAGEEEEEEDEVAHLSEKIQKAGLPQDATKVAKRELKRLKSLQPHHPEYTSTHSYLELLASLPWQRTPQEKVDLRRARRFLDEDHRGLEKVKTRLLEFLAVVQMRGNMKGPILCLHGPPGIGKTSLGRSVARALGRKFHRIALGGVLMRQSFGVIVGRT